MPAGPLRMQAQGRGTLARRCTSHRHVLQRSDVRGTATATSPGEPGGPGRAATLAHLHDVPPQRCGPSMATDRQSPKARVRPESDAPPTDTTVSVAGTPGHRFMNRVHTFDSTPPPGPAVDTPLRSVGRSRRPDDGPDAISRPARTVVFRCARGSRSGTAVGAGTAVGVCGGTAGWAMSRVRGFNG